MFWVSTLYSRSVLAYDIIKLYVYDHFCNLNSLYRIADVNHNDSQEYIISFDLFVVFNNLLMRLF